MKIGQRDRIILAAAHELGDDSVSRIAQASGVKDHVARRVLQDALEKGTLTRRVFVNSFDLGLQQYALRFSLGARSSQHRKRVRDTLMKAPFVELLQEFSGNSDFMTVLTVRNVFDLENLLNSWGPLDAFSMTRTQMQARTGWVYFGAKYLHPAAELSPLPVIPTKTQHHLSREDARLLRAYGTHPTGKLSDIARSVGRTYQRFSIR